MAVLRKTWVTILGWVFTVAGIGLLALPGPGLLTLVAGLAILSQEYEWAERRLHPVKQKAFEAAAVGVETWPRIAMSTLGALVLIAVGVVWWVDPEIPELWFLGPVLSAPSEPIRMTSRAPPERQLVVGTKASRSSGR